MIWLAAKSLFYLVRADMLMHQRGIAAVHVALSNFPLHGGGGLDRTSKEICRAVDVASVLYFKRVLCLQRSVATTMLLRRYGLAAELVIGARVVPFKTHAWVELDGTVMNDKSYIPEMYRELARC